MNVAKANLGSVKFRPMETANTHIGNARAGFTLGASPTLSQALSAVNTSSRLGHAPRAEVLLQKHSEIKNEGDLQRYAAMIKATQHKSDFLLDYTPADDFVIRRELYRLTNQAAVSTGISAPNLLDTAAGALLGPLKVGVFAFGAIKGATKTVTTLPQLKKKMQRYIETYVAKYEKAIKKIVDDKSTTRDEKLKTIEWHLEHQYNLSEHFHDVGPKYKGMAAARVEEKLHHVFGEVLDMKR